MPTAFNIPLSPQSQTLQVTLGGTLYGLALTWREPYGWFLDISDASQNPLVSGIPLTTGADLLQQFGSLGFPGQLWVVTPGDPDATPGYADLGVNSFLYFLVP